VTVAQRRMFETLRETGPLDSFEMYIEFGRSWQRVWERLEDERPDLVRYAPYAKDGRHYRITRLAAQEKKYGDQR
jgi:hypothetical protein